MGLGCSQLVHRRVTHDLKYSLWLVEEIQGKIKKVFSTEKSSLMYAYLFSGTLFNAQDNDLDQFYANFTTRLQIKALMLPFTFN
jgi:hypothetical protein